MDNRYSNTRKLLNNSTLYKQLLNQKKLNNLIQYTTFDFKNLKNLKDYNLDVILHTVQPNESLFMISQKYYNAPEYGWLICYTNRIGSELQINDGDILKIYVPLEMLLELL
jgi:hypothetical protein